MVHPWTPSLHLDDLVGQERVKAGLRDLIESAKRGQTTLGHILIAGPSGSGKAAFAQAAANEFGTPQVQLPADAYDDPIAISELAMRMPHAGILIVERLEDLSDRCKPVIYDCVTQTVPRVMARQEVSPASGPMHMPAFTVIATAERVPTVLKAGGFTFFILRPYALDEVREIVLRAAREARLTLDRGTVDLLILHSGRVPEMALTLLGRLRRELKPALGATIRFDVAQKTLAAMGYR